MQPSLPSRRPLWLKLGCGIGVAVILLGVLAFAGLVWLLQADFSLGEDTENLTVAQIESVGRIKLPPSARNVHGFQRGFQDRFIHIRFDIDPDELALLSGTRYWPALDETGALGVPFQQSIEPNKAWWQPRQAQRFYSGHGGSDNIAQSVLVDVTDPNNYIVYVATFES